MKKYLLISAAIVALFSSCSKVENGTSFPSKKVICINANTSNNETKLTYADTETSYKAKWDSGDKLSIAVPGVIGNENVEFSNIGGNHFSGEVTEWSGSKYVYGVYPYSATARDFTSAVLSVDISNQNIKVGNNQYDNTLLVAMGQCASSEELSELDLEFTQVMSILKITVTDIPAGAKVIGVAVSSSTESLVESAKVDMSDGTVVDGTETTSEYIMASVDGAELGGESDGKTIVNLALLPTTVGAQYTITVQMSTNVAYAKTLKATNTVFEGNTIYPVTFAISSENRYIENGVDYGPGIQIGSFICAPVNLGYAENPPYGLYYQRGSKKGLNPNSYTVQRSFQGTIGEQAENVFYRSDTDAEWADEATRTTAYKSDWTKELSPNWCAHPYTTKGEHDPCPAGWRIVYGNLFINHENISYGYGLQFFNSHYGYWVDGKSSKPIGLKGLFLTTTGYIDSQGNFYGLDSYGQYWIADNYNYDKTARNYIIDFGSNYRYNSITAASKAQTIRCMKVSE